MKMWVLYSLVAMVLWGGWGFFGKMAARTVSQQNLLLLASVGAAVLIPAYAVMKWRGFQFDAADWNYYFAILAGVLAIVAGFFYYLALTRGPASLVVPLTAAYPVVTLVLAYFFLGEAMTVQKIVGMVLAIAGIGLLATSS